MLNTRVSYFGKQWVEMPFTLLGTSSVPAPTVDGAIYPQLWMYYLSLHSQSLVVSYRAYRAYGQYTFV